MTSLQSENRDLWRGQGVTPWGVRDPEDAPGAYGSDLWNHDVKDPKNIGKKDRMILLNTF